MIWIFTPGADRPGAASTCLGTDRQGILIAFLIAIF